MFGLRQSGPSHGRSASDHWPKEMSRLNSAVSPPAIVASSGDGVGMTTKAATSAKVPTIRKQNGTFRNSIVAPSFELTCLSASNHWSLARLERRT